MASELYAEAPSARLTAASRLTARQRRSLAKQAENWPADSPGSLNAWLLMVTTKAPTWRDPYIAWRDVPPTIGAPHEGFFYPDPLGFWAEIRHWATVVTELQMAEALSVTTVLHGAAHLTWALGVMRPHVLLFLDEPAAETAGLAGLAVDRNGYVIRDPYRSGQSYEGWWGRSDGMIVGKSPQHPAAHKLYRRTEMEAFLQRSAPARST
jgi:hypothetical protein